MANMENNENSAVPNAIKLYFSLAVLPLGCILNAVSGRVFFKPTLNKSTNIGMLYGILCLLNVLSLFNMLIFNVLDYMQFNYQYSEFTCKLMNILEKVPLQFPSYQQVLISFFLWLSISHPHKFKFCINLKETIYFEMGMGMFVILMSMSNLVYHMDYKVTPQKVTKQFCFIFYPS